MNGLLFLCLTVVFSSGVALTMKAANHQQVKLGPFLVVNYAVCTGALMASGGWRHVGTITLEIWFLGIFVGYLPLKQAVQNSQEGKSIALSIPSKLKYF